MLVTRVFVAIARVLRVACFVLRLSCVARPASCLPSSASERLLCPRLTVKGLEIVVCSGSVVTARMLVTPLALRVSYVVRRVSLSKVFRMFALRKAYYKIIQRMKSVFVVVALW